ncbi:MAG: hypothetical protein F6K28_18730 [Microcoleus sp. SIO2G3]|nr:hypothetical protein [Microcoleus sp. SIO2G3]
MKVSPLTWHSLRVDDVPVAIKWLSQMQIEALINQEVPPPHGNRQGLSYGQLAVLLLSYMITQADHRLCAVETWVKQHHQTLELATGWKIADKDATDDRLADLLSVLGGAEHQATEAIETLLLSRCHDWASSSIFKGLGIESANS